jgi:MFS family permease
VSQPKVVAERAATFGEIFAVGEYRALYSATALSWTGDYLARAAVAAIVYHTTRSVALSAGSFAISYLPALTAGPVLAALAERYPRRTVMMICDIVRGCTIAAVAVPGMPITAIFALLFTTALLSAPFDASRSALLAQILSGDRYIVAVSAQNTTNGIAMMLGYFAGGIAAPDFPHVTIAIDAATFAASAVLIRYGTKDRPAALAVSQRTGLLRETAAGFGFVTRHPLLRAIAILSLGATLLAIVPEGLAAAWAARLAHNSAQRGLDQALIMMSVPVGLFAGGIVVGRFLSPGTRRRLIRPFALVVPIALALALLDPSVAGIAAIGFIIGFAVTGLFLPTNGLYAQALPAEFRARAFGVFQFGAQLVQATGVFVTGLLADRYALHVVVGLWGVMGILLMTAAVTTWPSPERIDAELNQTTAAPAFAGPARSAFRPSQRRAAHSDGDETGPRAAAPHSGCATESS